MSYKDLYAPYITPDLEEHRLNAREFAEKKLAPIRDRYEELNLDGKGLNFPWEALKLIGENGFLAMYIPEAYGGRGKPLLYDVITIEEFSRVCGAMASITQYTPSLVCSPLLLFGTEEQKKKYLPPLVKGEKLGAFALTEPDVGSDTAAIRTRAERTGSFYIINGHKKFITIGNLASTFIVFAKTKPEAGARGITAFIVEREMEGISFPKQERKLGLRYIPVSEVKLENVKVPAENVLGGVEMENRGIYIALNALDHGRCYVAAQAIGAAQAALEQALKFAEQRVEFEQPIISFEAIQWMIADMTMRIEASRLLTYRATYLRDLAIKGKIDSRAVTLPAAIAKCYASETATFAAHRSIQILGGRGYMHDYEYIPVKPLPPLEKIYRDCRIYEIYEGTNEIQRYVISREIARLYGVKIK